MAMRGTKRSGRRSRSHHLACGAPKQSVAIQSVAIHRFHFTFTFTTSPSAPSPQQQHHARTSGGSRGGSSSSGAIDHPNSAVCHFTLSTPPLLPPPHTMGGGKSMRRRQKNAERANAGNLHKAMVRPAAGGVAACAGVCEPCYSCMLPTPSTHLHPPKHSCASAARRRPCPWAPRRPRRTTLTGCPPLCARCWPSRQDRNGLLL
jgi:hypothetical protein